MKATITKKLLTFILLASGMFSFSSAGAQCVCLCTNNGQPRYNAECYTRDNGTLGCRNTRCRDGVTGEQDIETFSLFISSNPASSSIAVPFYGGQTENVSLKIFDVNGRLVTTLPDAFFGEEDNEITWNAADVNSGIYFMQLETASYSENRKLIVVK